mgnify:CR=1 FL=1
MNTEYMLPVCEKHCINLSFTRDFNLPKRVRHIWPRCSKKNCYADATRWLVVDLKEAVFGK